jgi:hypothetical protein
VLERRGGGGRSVAARVAGDAGIVSVICIHVLIRLY